jgi:hypothetical protein
MPSLVCPLNHALKPHRSVVLINKSEGRRGEVLGSEMVWWAHVNVSEAHVLPEDDLDYGDLLAEER